MTNQNENKPQVQQKAEGQKQQGGEAQKPGQQTQNLGQVNQQSDKPHNPTPAQQK